MAYYLEITAVQAPFQLPSLDGNNRIVFSCNFDIRARSPITQLEENIASLLVAAGVGTTSGASRTIYVGSLVTLPAPSGTGTDIAYIQIVNTGGTYPEYIHNSQAKIERLSVQILVRALTYPAVRDKAVAVYQTLDNKRNVNVA